jgi:hypothetical protein
LEDPPSYQREITDVVDERYQLVSRQNNTLSYHEMDPEVQQMVERDTKLKRNIRKFRFIVRSLHLACRYDCFSRGCFWHVSLVVVSLLAANFAGINLFGRI